MPAIAALTRKALPVPTFVSWVSWIMSLWKLWKDSWPSSHAGRRPLPERQLVYKSLCQHSLPGDNRMFQGIMRFDSHFSIRIEQQLKMIKKCPFCLHIQPHEPHWTFNMVETPLWDLQLVIVPLPLEILVSVFFQHSAGVLWWTEQTAQRFHYVIYWFSIEDVPAQNRNAKTQCPHIDGFGYGEAKGHFWWSVCTTFLRRQTHRQTTIQTC